MKVYEYILIPEVSNKYLDRILIECIDFKDLEKILLKDDTSKTLKFEKAKLKINPKNYTEQQIKELGVEYINNDTEKKLYNTLANVTVLKVSKIFSKQLSSKGLSKNVFNNTKTFKKHINVILKEVDICLLISYIRLKYKNLFDIIPSIIKELEDSDYYNKLNIPYGKYTLNCDLKFSEKYGVVLEFENNEDIITQKVDDTKNNLEIENNISYSIEDIIDKLKEINYDIINMTLDNNKIKALEIEAKNKDCELKKIYKELENLRKENNKLNINLDSLKKILIERENSIESLNSDIHHKVKKEIELKNEIKSLKEEDKKSKERLKVLENLHSEVDILKEKNINLENENKALKKKINDLTNGNSLDNPFGLLDNPPMY